MEKKAIKNLSCNILQFFVVLVLSVAVGLGCGSGGSRGSSEGERNSDINYEKQNLTGDWSSEITYSNNNKTVEILLDSYCMEFHKEVPSEGQQFGTASLTKNPFLISYSRYYNALYSFYLNSYSLDLIDTQRNAEKEYYESQLIGYRQLASITYTDSSINDILSDIIANLELSDDRSIFEKLFQYALWKKTDNLSVNDLLGEISKEEYLENILILFTTNNTDVDKIHTILSSLKKSTNDFVNKYLENAGILLDLIQQFEQFSSFNALSNNQGTVTIDLINGKKLGLINYTIEGTGDFLGRSLKLTINSQVDEILNIFIPPGLINAPSEAGVYRALVPSVKEERKIFQSFSKFNSPGNKLISDRHRRLSAASAQSMISVSYIDDLQMNNPYFKLSTDGYIYQGITYTALDIDVSCAEDPNRVSQFIINKFDNNESDRKEAEAKILASVKNMITSSEIPFLSSPGVSSISLENGDIALYCYGKFFSALDGNVDQYGINYGIFDQETADLLLAIASQSSSIITNPNVFRALNTIYRINEALIQRIINQYSLTDSQVISFILELYTDIVDNSPCYERIPNDPECYNPDCAISSNFQKVYAIGEEYVTVTYMLSCNSISSMDINNGENLQEPAIDLSGTWNVQETKYGNCEGSTYPQYEAYTATASQTGNDFNSIYTSDNETNTISGTISGNALTWQETRTDDNGTTSIDFSGTVSGDGNTINGTATWTWTDGSDNCSGTTQITVTRVTQLSVNVTGTWEGIWQSSVYGLSGTFTAIIIQHDSTLSGSIEVPEIEMYSTDLAGTATDDTIVFGDIENQITFTGTLSGDSMASGTYIYPSLYDNGTWDGTKELAGVVN